MRDAPDISDEVTPPAPDTEAFTPSEAEPVCIIEAETPSSAQPLPAEEAAPMIDIHPPQHGSITRRDFFVHLAIVTLGILIAIGLEQTVEAVHRHLEAREVRENIRQEIRTNIDITRYDLQQLSLAQQELSRDLDLLDSGAGDSQALALLSYDSKLAKRRDAAWGAAKINGSLALISPGTIEHVSYFYDSSADVAPEVFAYSMALATAQSLLDRARTGGRLTAFERQQLLPLTTSALGDAKFLSKMYSTQLDALNRDNLQ